MSLHVMKVYLLIFIVVFGSCKQKKTPKKSHLTPEFEVKFSTSLVQPDETYKYLGEVKIQNRSLIETSGICASRRIKGLIWAHNDSGDPARIFAFGENGEDYATIYLEGATHYDYEDICMGKYKQDSLSYIFVADIGDNRRKRETIQIYRFPEPTIDTTSRGSTITIPAKEITTFTLSFPDGPRDAESIMFDPIEEVIYILSKREEKVGIYRVLVQSETSSSLVLFALLPLTWVVAGDISSDGNKIAVETGDSIWCWERIGNEPIGKALQRIPLKLPYQKEKQGEAFTWNQKGNGYFTMGEGSLLKPSRLRKYEKTE